MSVRLKVKRWFFQDIPESATWEALEEKARQNKVRWFISETGPSHL